MAKKASEKFDFDITFQWEILRFTIKDKNGYRALLLYKHDYFDILDQQIIARAIHSYFKIKKRIPSGPSILIEEAKKLYRSRDYATSLLEADRKRIRKRILNLYKKPARDGEDILEKCKLFASFVELKSTLENIDLNNFSQYETYSKKIHKAVTIGFQVEDKKGIFLVSQHRTRFIDRHNRNEVVPTPYNQINRLTNAGGTEKGSLIVIVDQPKKSKTMTLVNLAKSYMGRRGKSSNKKVIYFDLENGETPITTRLDQSVCNLTKKEVLSGEYDKKLAKAYRAWERLGGEVLVRRLPALSTTDDCQRIIDEIYQELGIRFEVAIFDYVGLMGSTTGKKDDFERISDAYLDVKNFAQKNELDVVYTAHHVVRGAYKKRATKYSPEDLAKCIDIERHVDALWGIQQNEEEKAANLMRIEILAQRDGVLGRAIFNVSVKHQRITELSESDLQKYYAAMGDKLEDTPDEIIDQASTKGKAVKSDI